MKSKASKSKETSREKLIQSADRLFADRGFDGVSVRDIANDAGVNSALVGYYFRGKEGLLAEVYMRHCEPLKLERTRLLKEYGANGKRPTLEQILDAFIRPSLQESQGTEADRSFSRLRAILSAENSLLLEQLVAQNLDETDHLFVNAFSKCLPKLSTEAVFWRFHFLLGALYYTAMRPYRIKTLSKGKCDVSDAVATTEELIHYASAGFRAPTLVHERRKARQKTPAKGKLTKR